MKEPRVEALRWLRQAENDLQYARLGLREGFSAQVCFLCQQIAEKALKSVHYGKLGKRIVYGHSLVELAQELSVGFDLHRELALLDQYYIPTRYPNGLPGGAPYEVYSLAQAEAAVAVCDRVISFAHASLPEE
ncbi:MAG: HEPN domain-containing protein [Spirochaetia bacterium]